jgi:hypothetical protein
MSALAGAGVAGAIVAAVGMLKQQIAGAISGAGQVAGKFAAGDASGIGDAFDSVAGKMGVFGAALTGARQAVDMVVDGFESLAGRLARFSPDLAVVKAQDRVAQIQGDIRRAQKLGPELAEFTRARTDFKQGAQDLMADIAKEMLPLVTTLVDMAKGIFPLVKTVAQVIGDLFKLWQKFAIDSLTLLGNIIDVLNGPLGDVPDWIKRSVNFLEKIGENTEKPREKVGAALYDVFNTKAPDGAPAGRPGGVDNRLNMPAFGGL